jgi:hypothetical protein
MQRSTEITISYYRFENTRTGADAARKDVACLIGEELARIKSGPGW